MTSPLRPCGRAECRLCHPEGHVDDSLAQALLGMAAIILLAAVAFVLLPALAG